MEWYSDEAVRAAFPGAETLSPADLGAAISDATAVYDYAQRNPGISDAALRVWGERQRIGPDRINVAFAILRASGKLFLLPPSAPIAATEAPVVDASRLVDAFSATELRSGAERLGLDLPKSATKAELAEAIATAPPG